MKLAWIMIIAPALVYAQAAGGGNLPPDTLVAIVDGNKVTAAELQAILRALPPQTQQQALSDSKQFLEQYGLLRRLSGLAEKEGLDRESPWKDQIEYHRLVTLAQAKLTKAANEMSVSDEDLKKYYEANKQRYDQVKVKAIYFPFSAAGTPQKDPKAKQVLTESEAKARAEKVLAQIRGGADFVKMVAEYSGDPVSAANNGDFGVIRRSDSLPEPVKSVLFALKPGEVSEPVRQPNGFYLFRVEEKSTESLEQVRGQISEEARQVKLNEWMESTRNSISIKVENDRFFHPPAAAPAPPAPAK